MSEKNRRVTVGLIVSACLIVALCFWPKGRVKVDSGHRLVMGTFANVIAVAEDSGTANRCIKAAFVEIEKVDELMSDYKSDSEIAEINRSAYKAAVKVSKSTFEVFQKALEFSKLTAGAFDVTIGPLADLWRLAAEANSVPSDNELQQARTRVGYELLYLDVNEMSVRFAVEGMRVDLGGIAKGYAVDKAAEAMQKGGAVGGMVEVGGDIRCFGAPPRGKDRWRIGLQDSRQIGESISEGKLLLVLELTDAAVATSGSYRRFAVIQGQRFSHILDTKTGYTSEELTSVTIIGESATDADALATAVSVMGAEKGLALIETIPQTEAILITSPPECELIKTTGAEKFIIDD